MSFLLELPALRRPARKAAARRPRRIRAKAGPGGPRLADILPFGRPLATILPFPAAD